MPVPCNWPGKILPSGAGAKLGAGGTALGIAVVLRRRQGSASAEVDLEEALQAEEVLLEQVIAGVGHQRGDPDAGRRLEGDREGVAIALLNLAMIELARGATAAAAAASGTQRAGRSSRSARSFTLMSSWARSCSSSAAATAPPASPRAMEEPKWKSAKRQPKIQLAQR